VNTLIHRALCAYQAARAARSSPARKLARTAATSGDRPRTFLAAASAFGVSAAAGIKTQVGNHTFRATGITAYLKNGGSLENAAAVANHAFDPHHAAQASREARGDPRRGGADFDLKDFQRLLFVTRSRGPVDGTSLSLVNSMSR
jgi:hypothetical protein